MLIVSSQVSSLPARVLLSFFCRAATIRDKYIAIAITAAALCEIAGKHAASPYQGFGKQLFFPPILSSSAPPFFAGTRNMS